MVLLTEAAVFGGSRGHIYRLTLPSRSTNVVCVLLAQAFAEKLAFIILVHVTGAQIFAFSRGCWDNDLAFFIKVVKVFAST